MNSTSSPGNGIPLFDTARRGQLISRVTRPQVVVLFAFFVAGCTIVVMRTVLFEYVPALVRSVFPALARLLEKPRVAKGIPNYFDGKAAVFNRAVVVNCYLMSLCKSQQFQLRVCRRNWRLRVARNNYCGPTSERDTSALLRVVSHKKSRCRRCAPSARCP